MIEHVDQLLGPPNESVEPGVVSLPVRARETVSDLKVPKLVANPRSERPGESCSLGGRA